MWLTRFFRAWHPEASRMCSRWQTMPQTKAVMMDSKIRMTETT